jgi:hypothetical protein
MNPVWSITGWSAEYKQVGPRNWEYRIKDPDGKVWHQAGQDWFGFHDASFEDLKKEMENKTRRFVLTYASKKAEVQEYTFFDKNDDLRSQIMEK